MGSALKNRPAQAGRSRWHRLYVLVVVILLMAPLVAYLAAAAATTREARLEYALRRSGSIAQSGARLLDAQCGAAVSAVRVLAAASQGGDGSAAPGDIPALMRRMPDLAFAGIFRRDGTPVAYYPEDLDRPGETVLHGWFLGVTSKKSPAICGVVHLTGARPGDAIALAMVVGREERPARYWLAYYRLGGVQEWLRQVGAEDGLQAAIVTLHGRTLAVSDRAMRLTGMTEASLLNLARHERAGTQWTARSGKQEASLLGYAMASVPDWVVVVQPPGGVLAAADYLNPRVLVLYLPVLVLTVAAARALARLYRQQADLTQQLADQNEQLRTADRVKSEFLANISHDLWTPLTGIHVAISGLLDKNIAWKAEEAREHLLLAGEEADQLIARVRNLLEMARLDTCADRSQKAPCDLEEIAGAVLERLKLLLADRRVDVAFAPMPLLFNGRPAQFEIVVMNLLENAVKYSPPGSPLLMCGELHGKDIYFALSDHGPGVRPGDTERIFEKFYRAEPVHERGGAGLGLAICKTIIEEHGGLIGVVNPPGGGAKFWFSVPALYWRKELS